jgi:disulfide bond formation protein DsbB
MHKFKIKTIFNLIFLLCLISIISAYFIEYILGHQPCNLCLIERIPYALGLILIILNYTLIKKEQFIILLLILTFAFSLIISFYHFGIEQGFFEESSVCGLKNVTDTISKEELLKQLGKKTISCKDVTFKIFGLSLTSYNILLSILILFFTIKLFLNYEKN